MFKHFFMATGFASVAAFTLAGAVSADTHYEVKRLPSAQSDSSEMMVRLIVSRETAGGTISYDRIKTPYSQVEAVRTQLLEDPDVVKVEINMPMTAPDPLSPSSSQSYMRSQENTSTLYNDTLFDRQDYFDPVDQYSSRIALAHERLSFENTVRIGIVDGGFVDSAEAQFVEGASMDFGRGPAYFNSDPETGCADASDPTIHGYQVAQVAAATNNNLRGIAGVADNVQLVAARALDCDGIGFAFEISEAVRWLAGDTITDVPDISEPVDIINMSLGGSGSCATFTQDAIDFARSQGIPVIVSAGNDGASSETVTPANCNGVITVAATTRNGTVASFSNTGSNVDIAAQGSEMPVLDENDQPFLIFGTSFSAPVVTGVLAGALSNSPGITPASFDLFVSRAGKPINDPLAQSPQVGAGILDSMFLLDEAGVPRQRVGLSGALSGDREQYAEALLHPTAESFLVANIGTGACDLAEVTDAVFEGVTNEFPLTVFSVPWDQPLVSDGPTTEIASDPEGKNVIVSLSELASIEDSGDKLGISKCDSTDQSTCTVEETVVGLNPSDIQVSPSCSP